MTDRIDHLPTGSQFSFNDKIYVILFREGNMSEVKDSEGRRWAWPNESKVRAIRPQQYYHAN